MLRELQNIGRQFLKFCKQKLNGLVTRIIIFPYIHRWVSIRPLDKCGDPKVVVSLTSYGKRLETVDITIRSILRQSYRPDLIVLYLAGHESLPLRLKQLIPYGLRVVEGCEDLKPHKKYYWAMQEYPDASIITIDDDVVYARDTIRTLMETSSKFPSAVVACRVNKIRFDKNGSILPYAQWTIQYTDSKMPAMDLLATGVGGVLYPPHLMPVDVFDKRGIYETSLMGDDLWLKANEIKAGIPTVWAPSLTPHPRVVPDTQKNALMNANLNCGGNDIQLQRIMNFLHIESADFKDDKE